MAILRATPPFIGPVVEPVESGIDSAGPYVKIPLAEYERTRGVDVMTDRDRCGLIWRFAKVAVEYKRAPIPFLDLYTRHPIAIYRPATREESQR